MLENLGRINSPILRESGKTLYIFERRDHLLEKILGLLSGFLLSPVVNCEKPYLRRDANRSPYIDIEL